MTRMPAFANAHPVALGAAAFVAAVFALRTALWRFMPRDRRCDTCGHVGPAKRVIRGAVWIEVPILIAGMSIGLVVHLILMFAILVFLWRTFGAYLTCANCGSERLEKVRA